VIDWIVAERIARLVAEVGPRPVGSAPAIDLAGLAAESERRVVAYTGLEPAGPLPAPEGIGRREWVAANIGSMRALLGPVLDRAANGLGPVKPVVQIGAGLMMSAEVGVIVGYLAQRVLGQYELVLIDESASPHPPRLLFVLPNLGQAVEAFDADEREFMTWVTLHEVTHAVQFAGVPWLQGHLASLVGELLGSAEARIEAPHRLRLPTRPELERLYAGIRSGDLFSIVMNKSERDTIDRVQAVMAVIEGHAEHVMDAVAPDLLPSLPRLRRSLDSRRRTQSRLSRLVGRLLGLELKLRQYERGKAFCDAIVRRAGPGALRVVFSAPEALPSLAEIGEPTAWLERTGAARLAEAS
jgi:coenzyme F420 biosynthesis associated uncharacterized protein